MSISQTALTFETLELSKVNPGDLIIVNVFVGKMPPRRIEARLRDVKASLNHLFEERKIHAIYTPVVTIDGDVQLVKGMDIEVKEQAEQVQHTFQQVTPTVDAVRFIQDELNSLNENPHLPDDCEVEEDSVESLNDQYFKAMKILNK